MLDLCPDVVTGPTVADTAGSGGRTRFGRGERRRKSAGDSLPDALKLKAAVAELRSLLQPTGTDRTLPVAASQKGVAENPLAG